MSNDGHRSVHTAPPKPLMVFDGTCHFCRLWIERWRQITAGGVEYAPYQEEAARFPEIPREAFERSVQFIETSGLVFDGAEAVFHSLGQNPRWRWMIWCYENLPGFATISEIAYRFVAGHRDAASFFTRALWGADVRRPEYFVSRNWFLRSLGGIYLIAFLSLWWQIDGLIGAQGILPVAQFLSAARDQLGASAPYLLPTLSWLDSSNAFLHFLCAAGAIASILLIAGFLPIISLVLLFLFYLSLTIAGQTFLSFQWDILLLETGFLAIFFAPFSWRISTVVSIPISRLGHFLLKFLLFKLMLMSGVVKLTSGDDSWWNLTALDFHYWTQPLPTIFGWWSQQGPEWFQKCSTFFVLFVESVVPFFLWAPRRLRHIACGLLVSLQVLIALTGNYCFFNLLTIALCLLLIEDAAWPQRFRLPIIETNRTSVGGYWKWPAIAILFVTLPLNGMLIVSAFKPDATWPAPITALYSYVEPFRIANGYGLFRVMTKSRPEIIIEGSADGIDWRSYEFEWKPGDLNRVPRWAAPHQPRLDWQMWFAALGNYRNNPWFVRLAECLLHNNPEVTRLLARNPFPREAPRYIRATVYEYRFTTLAEHQSTGAWWKREEHGEYLPVVSLHR